MAQLIVIEREYLEKGGVYVSLKSGTRSELPTLFCQLWTEMERFTGSNKTIYTLTATSGPRQQN